MLLTCLCCTFYPDRFVVTELELFIQILLMQLIWSSLGLVRNCCDGDTHVPNFGDDGKDETHHDSLGKNRKCYQHNTLQARIWLSLSDR
jgi:hypothetical protein